MQYGYTKTGNVHAVLGSRPSCYPDSTNLRVPRITMMSKQSASRVGEEFFCKKCFPKGKPNLTPKQKG